MQQIDKPAYLSEAVDIDSLRVSGTWKARFKAIHKAGGPKLPYFSRLTLRERLSAYFNVLAGLFGPFYYISKGMWRKGLALFGAAFVAVLILKSIFEALGYPFLTQILAYGVGAVFAARGNIDYYKKMVLKDESWW
jgi:hypothetical protein